MGAYRDNFEALRGQVESLERDIERAERNSDRHEALRRELEAKIKQLETARIEEVERQAGAARIRRRAVAAGIFAGAALAAAGYQAVTHWPTAAATAPVGLGAIPASSAQGRATVWFRAIRPRCNSVEVTVAVRESPAPPDVSGQSRLAACFALAGRIDESRLVIDALPVFSSRSAAAQVVFQAVHPVADAGDDVAAGPAMEMVVHYTPGNYMAVYHAGMSAFRLGRDEDARTWLDRFLEMYRSQDVWRTRATNALTEMRSRPAEDCDETCLRNRRTFPVD